jgi:tetratricopeptide (TPR) repeat protein
MYQRTNRKGALMSNVLCHIFCLIAAILIPIDAYAKSASEVFEIASKSTVVVLGYDSKGKTSSLGSGVVMPDGTVATNCHVIQKAARLVVRYQKKEYQAVKRYTDWDRDTCTLMATDLNASPVTLGSTNRLKIGARVYTIGAPQGLELTISEGIVSNLREIGGGQYIQTTAPISPGSSGGGLFDDEGHLLGLTSFYLAKGQNLNFALPVEWINELPKRHKETTQETTRTVKWVSKALELQSEKNWRGMLAHCQRWASAEPKNAEAWFSLGVAYSNSNQITKGIDAYQQTLRINPQHVSAWYNLGYTYSQAGQNIKAIESYRQALRLNPEHTRAWYNLGRAYEESGQTGKAIEAYQQTLRVNPEDSLTWGTLGLAFIKTDQISKAIECCQRALRINQEDELAWYTLGLAYKIDGQHNGVIDVYKQLKRLDPKLADKFFNEIVSP